VLVGAAQGETETGTGVSGTLGPFFSTHSFVSCRYGLWSHPLPVRAAWDSHASPSGCGSRQLGMNLPTLQKSAGRRGALRSIGRVRMGSIGDLANWCCYDGEVGSCRLPSGRPEAVTEEDPLGSRAGR
jgi:hypothetical protein